MADRQTTSRKGAGRQESAFLFFIYFRILFVWFGLLPWAIPPFYFFFFFTLKFRFLYVSFMLLNAALFFSGLLFAMRWKNKTGNETGLAGWRLVGR